MTRILIIWLFIAATTSLNAQESWSHFRGDHLDGRAEGTGYPIRFGEDTNMVWKVAVPDLGYSSPIVRGNQVWLSSATVKGDLMLAICYDLTSGELLQQILLFSPDTIQSIHSTNSYATPTGAIEEGFVYLHYGTYGTACVNTRDFSVVWKRTDLNCQHMQGAASSLMIQKDLLIVHIEGTDVQYIAALDKKTGKTVWKTERPKKFYENIVPVYRKAYTTPIVVTVDGRDQLISNGAQMCIAYDVHTGEEIWSVWYGYDSTVGMPLVYNGLVYFNSGWIAPEEADKRYVRFFAVDPAGKGDVTHTHVKWEYSVDVPQISTPVVVDGRIYMVHERGALTCVDALTGKVIWKDKLKGQFNASPVYAGGHLYFPEVGGRIFVIKPGDTFQLVAENRVTGQIKATPAFVNGAMLLRSKSHLYKFAIPNQAR